MIEPAAIFRALFSAGAGFLGYGSWAWFANSAFGSDVAWRAFFTQGGYSFTVTLIMTLILEVLYRRTSNVATSVAIVCVLLYSSSWAVNWLAGTPEILMTILPGAVIGTVYCAVWCIGLARAETSLEERVVAQKAS